MNRDLTVGDSGKVLRRFCLPLFASVIFQQLYNIADSLVAGRFIGENALAAVGNSYEITLIFIAIAFGCNIGCSVVVSTYFGAKRYAHVKTAVSTAMIGMIILCGALMAADLLLRVALAILFSFTPLRETGIWCAWPVGWIIAAVMSVGFYRRFARDGWL